MIPRKTYTSPKLSYRTRLPHNDALFSHTERRRKYAISACKDRFSIRFTCTSTAP